MLWFQGIIRFLKYYSFIYFIFCNAVSLFCTVLWLQYKLSSLNVSVFRKYFQKYARHLNLFHISAFPVSYTYNMHFLLSHVSHYSALCLPELAIIVRWRKHVFLPILQETLVYWVYGEARGAAWQLTHPKETHHFPNQILPVTLWPSAASAAYRAQQTSQPASQQAS